MDSKNVLIAVILSAQATDISVNKATKKLFEIIKAKKQNGGKADEH